MKYALFWDITRRRVVIPYWRFGTIYPPHLQGPEIPRRAHISSAHVSPHENTSGKGNRVISTRSSIKTMCTGVISLRTGDFIDKHICTFFFRDIDFIKCFILEYILCKLIWLKDLKSSKPLYSTDFQPYVFIIIIVIIIMMIIIITTTTLMHGFCNYVHETSRVSRVYSVAAVL